ncbi:peptidase MA family metallohydrolase [Embleya sp. NBC_00896]|uniref:peptidase MA family metallohydrolase n=1 Tax=Embleya sp. NBC_00896 TaxID=2975961 RepID=UPI00386A3639|nr:hypothetical protein OG928_25495 [Embleya sp. NBC_00896]
MRADDPYGLWPDAVEPANGPARAVLVSILSGLLALALLVAGLAATNGFGGGATADRLLGDRTPIGGAGTDRDPAARPGPNTSPEGLPGGSTDPRSIRNTVFARVNAILPTQTAALEQNDEAAFARRFEHSDTTLVDEHRRLFRNLRRIPFDVARWSYSGNLEVVTADGSSPDRAGTAASWPVTVSMDVAFEHAIKGIDVDTVLEKYTWKARCADPVDPCAITAVSGAADKDTELGMAGYPAAWDLWELHVERRPHVVLMGPERDAALIRAQADTAERAAEYTIGTWKGGPGTSPGFALVLTSSRTSFGKLYRSESVQEWVAGYALALAGRDRPVGGVRMVVDNDELVADPTFAPILLRHEMTHALVAPLYTYGFGLEVPTWFHEGFADWQAGADARIAPEVAGNIRALITARRFTGELPADADFDTADEARVEHAYNLAHLVFRYLGETYGTERVCAFYANTYAGKYRTMDAALRADFGVGLDEVRTGWAAWVRKAV